MMQTLVGIIRTGPELEERKLKLDEFTERVKNIAVKGGRAYNPGWNLATDLPSMLTVSRSRHSRELAQGVARRSHPRGLPESRPRVREINFAISSDGAMGQPDLGAESRAAMPEELKALSRRPLMA